MKAYQVKSAPEYRQLGDECRSLAATMDSDDHRAVLLRMAEAWDRLAADSERPSPLEADRRRSLGF